MTLSDFVCHARLINEITLRITNNYGLVSHWELVSLLLNILSNAFEKLSLSSKLLYRVRGQSLIRFCLNDINTPGRARIHQVSSRRDRLRYLNAFLLYVPFLNCI